MHDIKTQTSIPNTTIQFSKYATYTYRFSYSAFQVNAQFNQKIKQPFIANCLSFRHHACRSKSHIYIEISRIKVSGVTCGLGRRILIRRSRVEILLLAARWICVLWSQIQLLHALLIVNMPLSCQLGLLTSFCLIYNICLLILVSTISTAVLNTDT